MTTVILIVVLAAYSLGGAFCFALYSAMRETSFKVPAWKFIFWPALLLGWL